MTCFAVAGVDHEQSCRSYFKETWLAGRHRLIKSLAALKIRSTPGNALQCIRWKVLLYSDSFGIWNNHCSAGVRWFVPSQRPICPKIWNISRPKIWSIRLFFVQCSPHTLKAAGTLDHWCCAKPCRFYKFCTSSEATSRIYCRTKIHKFVGLPQTIKLMFEDKETG